MRTIKKLFINTLIIYLALWCSITYISYANASTPKDPNPSFEITKFTKSTIVDSYQRSVVTISFNKSYDYNQIKFRHGDVSWVPYLASEAGWPKKTWKTLQLIILRESGGCPNRRGGDVVDKDCNIIRVSEWNHRSDTGLLQINGLNYDTSRNKWAAVCTHLDICTQDPLLDPLNNLKAGYLLYQLSGWDPWDPCAWGPDYANRCKASQKLLNSTKSD
jgi:hypothetical protein